MFGPDGNPITKLSIFGGKANGPGRFGPCRVASCGVVSRAYLGVPSDYPSGTHIWFGLVWFGLVRFGLVWFGLVRFGSVWSGLVWSGLVWPGFGRATPINLTPKRPSMWTAYKRVKPISESGRAGARGDTGQPPQRVAWGGRG